MVGYILKRLEIQSFDLVLSEEDLNASRKFATVF